MLRTLILAPMAVFALGASATAAADEFPRAATGAEVHADDGTVIGHVARVTRDRGGQITSMDIPGLAPPDVASLRGPMVADNQAASGREVLVIDRRTRPRVWVNQTSARERARLR